MVRLQIVMAFTKQLVLLNAAYQQSNWMVVFVVIWGVVIDGNNLCRVDDIRASPYTNQQELKWDMNHPPGRQGCRS